MKITVSGPRNSENLVIAQIIGDMLRVNGLKVETEEAPLGLNIDQIEHYIASYKKNEMSFIISVVKKDLPKKEPKFRSVPTYPAAPGIPIAQPVQYAAGNNPMDDYVDFPVYDGV